MKNPKITDAPLVTIKTLSPKYANQIQIITTGHDMYRTTADSLRSGEIKPIGWCRNALPKFPEYCKVLLLDVDGTLWWRVAPGDDGTGNEQTFGSPQLFI